jgi:hypothetical protein
MASALPISAPIAPLITTPETAYHFRPSKNNPRMLKIRASGVEMMIETAASGPKGDPQPGRKT